MSEKTQNRSGPEVGVATLQPEKPKGRGFAAMDGERQRAIASAGGRAAHEQGRAHEFTPEEAREAGRKGGQASGGARRNHKLAGQNQPASSGLARPEIEEQNEHILTYEKEAQSEEN
jgi:hypothetical protein